MNYQRVLNFAIAKPKAIYSLVLFITLLSLAMIPMIEIDTDPENMLSKDAPARVFHNQIKTDFLMRDMIIVGLVSESNIFTPDTLSTIEQLTNDVLQLDGVIKQDLLSLNVVDNITQLTDENGQNHGIVFEYLMKNAPTTTQGSAAIKHAVERLPMLNNTLVSGDDKAIAIYVPIISKDQSYVIAEEIRAISKNYINQKKTHLAFHITGLPVAEDQFGYEMFVQMGVAAPLAGLAIFVLLWYFFRNIPLIIAPMVVAMATVLIIMGSLIGLGFTVHIMSSMIAIFLMPIAVVDSVHILSEFADRYKAGDKASDTVKQVMGHLYTPMLFTSITSAVGFYSLMLTPIPPVKVFGAFIGTGILLAFVLTITYIPAYIARMKPETLANLQRALQRMQQKGRLANSLQQLGIFSIKRGKVILLAFIALFALSIEGITRIEINDNPVNWFKADHEIRISDKALNQHFAGTYDAWLVFSNNGVDETAAISHFQQTLSAIKASVTKSAVIKLIENWQQSQTENTAQASPFFTQNLLISLDDLRFEAPDSEQAWLEQLYNISEQALADKQTFTDPAILTWLANLQNALVENGDVGKVNSLVDIVRTVNRELNSGDNKDFAVPDTSNGVAQTLLQFQSSHRPQDLWHFVSPDYQKTLLWLQMTSGDNQHMTKVVNWVENYIRSNPPPANIQHQWAGKSYLNVVWQDAMVSGMIDSLLSSFIVVFLMMMLLFRSIKYGVLAMLPLTFTITMIYGLIGWFGKAYDMPIAVLSALTLGLSIDFAIHFIQRVRELENEYQSLTRALSAMFQEPSRAISRNAIVIAIGFTPLLLSPLMPYITVGFFLASIMIMSALVTLVLLPALLTLLNSTKKTA
ncbi:efflux RND transporter permease subunit [Cognaticolwellia mytili]|uniref:efflux RND transporter permease subunit n=1 Tax=Cognaticolwellia mytili TaxID=1888913 RepID=UPI001F46A066|nr:MMPL family transporter [Cognaticolwellia mytili]